MRGVPRELPQHRSVNQSDLDRTGTRLTAAPANTSTAGRENASVTCISFLEKGQKKMDRWVQNEEIVFEKRGRGELGSKWRRDDGEGVERLERDRTINGVMCIKLKTKRTYRFICVMGAVLVQHAAGTWKEIVMS